ncbi:MAG: hypothetical protein ACD_44C00400G0008 [uncultured bacterium]|nr:MAG: hypothetical protein ACD_44C00400G0008 [uncultured bacterium]OGT16681.1 MAG: UDP-N-acetylmuramoylalanine--D-glutamate ligase [Gammaproteobacteria bacterium RIFCSPHIGHO2_02_FULL_38_33]OGT23857.1 MAG: UDP-N-acetylmuramoylalanine--D-glutamate ligase [Gammaproteobacteria bacterium RIFCSPHIGHO2_12_38_15]OGT69135.1 MAG: UDP-N-acetylmuramoylalanine--D-glutamate ligase [Gammaproteobacteria bacterium RIFCSPLOWO2_02_FULL_38_11]OGT77731.1 MAG: UDP-N-acetylmuramoylalanine--D-glutamate ligase [Gamma
MTMIILGLGNTGLSCARFFSREKIPFQIIDTRENPPSLSQFKLEFPDTPCFLGNFYESILEKASEIILSPGLALPDSVLKKIQEKKINIIGDIELFVRQAKAPIIAITGSNAKGTVTTLVGNMLSAANRKGLVGGNIGVPALDLLTNPPPEFYVLELSSFQLETTQSLKAHAATVLNISPDHLDRHLTLENYISSKQRIYKNCKTAIYNGDDMATIPHYSVSKKITFGASSEFDFHLLSEKNEIYLAEHHEKLLPVIELKISGKHNWLNALAALALASTMDLPRQAKLTALQTFSGLPHRCQWLGNLNGVHWYDDSKGTNIGSTLAAIQGLGTTTSGKIILIAGGVGKGADFELLKEPVLSHVKTLLLLGQDAPLIADALKGCCEIIHVRDLEEASRVAFKISKSGDIVLLSPACASLDMFKDYHHRGEVFARCFRALRGT